MFGLKEEPSNQISAGINILMTFEIFEVFRRVKRSLLKLQGILDMHDLFLFHFWDRN